MLSPATPAVTREMLTALFESVDPGDSAVSVRSMLGSARAEHSSLEVAWARERQDLYPRERQTEGSRDQRTGLLQSMFASAIVSDMAVSKGSWQGVGEHLDCRAREISNLHEET